jgi:hypothetical protein
MSNLNRDHYVFFGTSQFFKRSLLCLVFIVALNQRVTACTLWGATGESTAIKGTLVSKNRDWVPDHIQHLKIVQPTNGHRYLGLFAEGGADSGIKAGINDQGLAVITATASSIPKKSREAQPETSGVMRKLLTNFSSVDEVILKKEIFAKAHAEFLIISDRTKIAVIEVGLDGTYAVKVLENGTLAHTNHFCEAALIHFNEAQNESSQIRYKRIQELLLKTKSPYTIADFQKMSMDQDAGANNSIWRTGSSPKKPRTLASWITEIPREGPPKLYVKIANPDSAPREHNLVLNEAFWDTPLPD